MRTVALILLAAALMPAALAAPPCPDDSPWPPPFRLEYDVKATRAFLSLSGDNALTLSRKGDTYALVSETSAAPLFSARQASRGRIGADGVVPAEYVERNGNRREMSARFDWQGDRVTFSASDNVVATQPRMQDRLGLLLQLGWLQRTHAAVFDLAVAGVRGASLYRFKSHGVESIDTPAGRFQTLKLERPIDADDDRLEVWLAPALCNLPVRVRFTDRKGQVILNELRAAKFD